MSQVDNSATGHCIGCGRDNTTGRLVNDVDTNSGAGWTNVLCVGCQVAGRSPWRVRSATDPCDYPVESASPQTKYGRECGG